jgi:hypothetical protein
MFEAVQNHKTADLDIAQIASVIGKREFHDPNKYVDILKAYFLVDASDAQIETIIRNAYMKYAVESVYFIGKHDLSQFSPILATLLLNRH